jgi:hypothetical protein
VNKIKTGFDVCGINILDAILLKIWYHIGENMEEIIIEKMSSNEQLNELFSNDELQMFLSILCSDASDQKRQDEFIKLIKGEEE